MGIGDRIRGGGGVAIEIEGVDSPWGIGSDDAVIRTDRIQESGHMILVSNDKLEIRLDDDNNDTGEAFKVYNGGDTAIMVLDKFGNLDIAGTINGSSDRHRKSNLVKIEASDILSKLAEMPLYKWQYQGEDVEHMGPMAQDFYQAFQLGKDKTSIAMVDADGISIAAIQALYKENRRHKEMIKSQQANLAQLITLFEDLKGQLEAKDDD